ncbi:MAG: magnesium transporter [Candidatus Gastranaerophilales bacterium]|nr:magnesium transporter [Candidatus Gastranaerophilales bacterium]
MLNVENIVDRIKEKIEDENFSQLKGTLDSYHSADLAEILKELKPEERLIAFKNIVEEDKAAEIIEYLPPQYQVELLSDLGEEYASKLIMKMHHDEIADVLADMEDSDSETYLNKLPAKFSNEVRELLAYKEDTAGGIMTPNTITVNKDMRVEDVLSFIRIRAEKDDVELYYLYVIDNQKHLLGVVSLRALLTKPYKTKVEDIMTKDIVKLHIDDPQDAVADIFMKYQYSALPVVDLYNRLKGMITWDDAQDIIEEETTDEIYTSSGINTDLVDEDEILSGSTINAIRARIPWLLITLVGEFIAVRVADHFEATLHAIPIIAIFMPLLAGLGGNIGTQSITLMVRGLSTGQVSLSGAFYHIFREMKVGLTIGIIFGALVSAVTFGWRHNVELGLVVGAAMVINMTLATFLGTITPFALKKINVDPAIASGPVIATTIDVLGLATYFTLVTIFLVKII